MNYWPHEGYILETDDYIIVLIKQISSWNVADIEDWKEQISSTVPENTPAIGIGVNTLYGFLGWDTQYHITDLPDKYQDLTCYIQDELPKLNAFFANERHEADFDGMDFFSKAAEFPIGNDTYAYYVRRETPVYALGDRLLFDENGYNAGTYVLRGITYGTARYSWTEGDRFRMHMAINGAPEMLHGTIELGSVYNMEQNVSVVVNGEEVYQEKVIDGNNIEFDFSTYGANTFVIELKTPDAVSPATLGESEDTRKLALGIVSMVIK